MRAPQARPARLLLAAAVAGGLSVVPLAVPGAPTTTRAAAAGRTTTVGPGVDLKAAMEQLNPGDTLRLAPGTYRTGMVLPNPATLNLPRVDAKGNVKKMAIGTSGARITVKAADPAHRPLILGEIKLWGPSFWTLDGLRVQAVDKDRDALYIGGGAGWTVVNSEFSGARQTGAFSNVSFAKDLYGTGAPRGFTFAANCVHDAARSTRSNTDHNVYVNFAGQTGSGGVITRNVIFGHPNGAGIKIGNGGVPRAPGPWGVKVTYNTIAQGGRQIFLHGDVRNNLVARNLLATSTAPFHADPRTTSVYVNLVVGAGNGFDNNYATGSSMFAFGGTVRVGADNAVRTNPRFTSGGCTGFHPAYAKAAAYGRYGSGALPRW